jgi:hypothetical protein
MDKEEAIEILKLAKRVGVVNSDKKIALDLAIEALSAPPQLTEEEVEKILPAKKTLISPWDSGFNVARESCTSPYRKVWGRGCYRQNKGCRMCNL